MSGEQYGQVPPWNGGYAQAPPTWTGPPPPWAGGPGAPPPWPPHPGGWAPARRTRGPRIAAVVVLGLAGLIGLIALFVPEARYTSVSKYSGTRTTTYGEWITTSDPPSSAEEAFPVSALQLTLAVVVALLAAVLLLLARGAVRSAARTLGAVAAGALAGITSVVVARQLTSLRYEIDNPDDPSSGFSSSLVLLPGTWLMLVGTVVALAAAVLLLFVRDEPPR